MNLKSLAQKIEQKIASSSDLELALQEYDAEMGQLAIDCLKNTKIAEASFSEKVLSKIKDIAQRPYANAGALSAITGLGGAAAGGLLSGNLVSKKELESKSDFEKRKRNTALIGALAGGALGAGTPGILNAVGALGSEPPSLKERILESINPVQVGATAAGAAAGVGVRNWNARLQSGPLKDLKSISGQQVAEKLPAYRNLINSMGGEANAAPFGPSKLVQGTAVNPYVDFINRHPRISSLMGKRPFIPSGKAMAPLIGGAIGYGAANYLGLGD